jgi:hypothetical protein
MFLENCGASDRFQAVELGAEVLIAGRNAGVADEGHIFRFTKLPS